MLYVGLDVHSRQSSLCILNASGGTVNQIQLKGPRAAVVDRLRQLDQPFSICYEASCGYGHLYEALRPLAHHIAVAHPGKLRLIYGSQRKNDRVDAQKLAKLLLLDMVPPVHVPSIDVRAWRSLIILRQRVMSQVVRCKNQIRGVLRENDIAGAKWLWSRRQLAWLQSLELHPVARLRLELAVEEFQTLDARIKRIERELQTYADRHPAVTVLMTIPGVGIRTAETFVAWVDDVTRFRNNRQIGSYFGLVPCQRAVPRRVGRQEPPGPHHPRRAAAGDAEADLRGGVDGDQEGQDLPRVLRAGDGRQARAEEDRLGGDHAPDDQGDGRNAAQRRTVSRGDVEAPLRGGLGMNKSRVESSRAGLNSS